MSNAEPDMQKTIRTAEVKLKTPPRISSVWIIPILSILIGSYLVVHHYLSQGPIITIHFKSADNLVAGKTKIKLLNIDVGEVTGIILNKKQNGVIVTAQMKSSIQELLREDSKFWIVKPRIGGDGISGLDTLLSGSYIQLTKGISKSNGNNFIGIEGIPPTSASVAGIRFTLTSTANSLLEDGTSIIYHGFHVGRIEKTQLDTTTGQIKYEAFINAPYDNLITQNTHFWNISGITLDTSAKGFSVKADSLEAIIRGGITFGVPSDLPAGDRAKSSSSFTLYPDEGSTYARSYAHGLETTLTFYSSVRGLDEGAPIEYRGIRVGQVNKINQLKDQPGKDVGIDVVIRLEPARIGLPDTADAVASLSKRIADLVKNGLYATIVSGNLLTGKQYIELGFTQDKLSAATLKKVATGNAYIPTQNSGIGLIQSKVSSILDSIDKAPIQRTIENTDQLFIKTAKAVEKAQAAVVRLDALLAESLDNHVPAKLGGTLAATQATLGGLAPDQPLYKNLNSSLLSLSRTLDGASPESDLIHQTESTLQEAGALIQELRPLIKQLNQKSNALIFNPGASEDLIPRSAAQPQLRR